MNKSRENKGFPLSKLRYTISNGIFLRGFCFSLAYSILTMFFNPRGITYSIDQVIIRFIIYTIMFSVGGIVISNMHWNYNKKNMNEDK